jgi:hypothetical protein
MNLSVEDLIVPSFLISLVCLYGLSKIRRFVGYQDKGQKWKRKILGKRYVPKILPEKNGEYLEDSKLLAVREYADVAAWLHQIYENSEWGFQDSGQLCNRDHRVAREILVYYNQQRVGAIEIAWPFLRLKKQNLDEIWVTFRLYNARQFDGYSVVDLAHQVARIVQPLECSPEYWDRLEMKIISKLILSNWQAYSVISEYEDRDQTLVFSFSGSGGWYKSTLKSAG